MPVAAVFLVGLDLPLDWIASMNRSANAGLRNPPMLCLHFTSVTMTYLSAAPRTVRSAANDEDFRYFVWPHLTWHSLSGESAQFGVSRSLGYCEAVAQYREWTNTWY